MKHRTLWMLSTILGLVLVSVSLLVLYPLDQRLWSGEEVMFTDSAGDTLVGMYYPGREEVGILLLEGFGSDQTALRSLVNEFQDLGAHSFTFDFSGHGRSSGSLGFDNAQTDRLARQVLVALDALEAQSDLSRAQIVLLGHSLGSRVALQAAVLNAEIGYQAPAGLILLGPQINLAPNTQAEFFTGVTDSELDWVKSLGPQNPPASVVILSGQQDDILPPQAARLLYARLAGETPADSTASELSRGSFETQTYRGLKIYSPLLHNYEIFAARTLSDARLWAAEMWSGTGSGFSKPVSSQSQNAALRIWMWLLGIGGIFLALVAGERWVSTSLGESSSVFEVQGNANIHIHHLKRFLWAKLLLWPAALIPAGLLVALFFLLPVGLPVINLIYVGFIGAYGLLLLLLYGLGKMPGTQGRLPFFKYIPPDHQPSRLNFGLRMLIVLLVFGATALLARSGLFYVYPANVRLFWLVAFSIPTAVGFWAGWMELRLINHDFPGNNKPIWAASLIGLFPFVLFTAFLGALGSLSGMLGNLQGLLILLFVYSFGFLLQRLGQKVWITAALQAALLYWLILPVGVLFSTS